MLLLVRLLLVLIVALNIVAISKKQMTIMDLVYDEASKHTNYPTTIAAISMQETSCLRKNVIGDDETSFGVTQFQLVTAREELRKIPHLAFLAKFKVSSKVLCADKTRISTPISNSSKISKPFLTISKSDLLPITIPIFIFNHLPLFI